MKQGRNDPCPCGSGKKYKHCCLVKDSTPDSAEFLWHKLKQLNQGLIGRLLDTAIESFGKEAIYEAWDEFMLWDEAAPGFDPESPHVQVFWPWFYHHWRPDPDDTAVKPGAPNTNRACAQAHHGSPPSPTGRGNEGEGMELTVTQAYLRNNYARLDPLARRYLLACHDAPFSFHEVIACEPGRGFLLRDILSGEERHVIEHRGSESAKPGDILFAQMVVLDELAQIEGCAPLMIPPIHKAPILTLRKKIASAGAPVTRDFLKQYDLEMFGVYHELIEPLLNPPIPKITNTDGDPMLFHRLMYDIDSPAAVFGALKGLASGATDRDLLAEAGYDKQNVLRRVEFSWTRPGNKINKGLSDTVLGNIRIDGHTLTVEVNSEKRAKKFVSLAKKLLGNRARYRTTVIESPEAMLRHGAPELSAAERAQQEALDSDPEVQAQLAQYLEAHYENWIDEKIPALGNKTPRQAVKTKDGREMVEALLTQFERDMHEQKMPGSEAVIERLRQHLKLDIP